MSRCDNTSAGVIVRNAGGDRFLVFDRGTLPAGTAPPAGHVDGHGSFEDAARAEVAEETGLTVVSLRLLTGGWRANRCRRAPGPRGVGHEWKVYEATVTGDLRPSARETRNARWVTAADLQALAGRTVQLARGSLDSAAFARNPGIEPVWVRWLMSTGLVAVPGEDLAMIEGTAK